MSKAEEKKDFEISPEERYSLVGENKVKFNEKKNEIREEFKDKQTYDDMEDEGKNDDDGKTDEIRQNYKKIKSEKDKVDKEIKNLEEKVEVVLLKQYGEYKKAFDDFMDQNRANMLKEIDELKRKHKEYQEKNNIDLISSERDFFRTEAVRLNGLCKEMSKKIEEMTDNMKILTNELNNLTTKWKESENVNKQLLVELESNIQSMKDLERENAELKDQLNLKEGNAFNCQEQEQSSNSHSNAEFKNESNFEIDYENTTQLKELRKDKLLYIIEKLKGELKKEKGLYHKNIVELNKMNLEKNQLQVIFSECLEEAKKDIINRKLRETLSEGFSGPKKRKTLSEKDLILNPGDFKFDKFLGSDKRKLMESFFEKEEAIEVLKNIVFHKPKEELNQYMYKNIKILNENRVCDSSSVGKKGKEFGKSVEGFDQFLKKKGTSLGFKFNLTNGLGKKTHLNFGYGGKLNKFK